MSFILRSLGLLPPKESGGFGGGGGGGGGRNRKLSNSEQHWSTLFFEEIERKLAVVDEEAHKSEDESSDIHASGGYNERTSVCFDLDNVRERRISELLDECEERFNDEFLNDSTTTSGANADEKPVTLKNSETARNDGTQNLKVDNFYNLFLAVNEYYETWSPIDCSIKSRDRGSEDVKDEASTTQVPNAISDDDTKCVDKYGDMTHRKLVNSNPTLTKGHPKRLLKGLSLAMRLASSSLGRGKKVPEDVFQELNRDRLLSIITHASEILSRSARNKYILISNNCLGNIIKLFKQLTSLLEVQIWKIEQRREVHFPSAASILINLDYLLKSLEHFINLHNNISFPHDTNFTIDPDIIRIFTESGVFRTMVNLISLFPSLNERLHGDDEVFLRKFNLQGTMLRLVANSCRIDVATQTHFTSVGGLDALLGCFGRIPINESCIQVEYLNMQLLSFSTLCIITRKNQKSLSYIQALKGFGRYEGDYSAIVNRICHLFEFSSMILNAESCNCIGTVFGVLRYLFESESSQTSSTLFEDVNSFLLSFILVERQGHSESALNAPHWEEKSWKMNDSSERLSVSVLESSFLAAIIVTISQDGIIGKEYLYYLNCTISFLSFVIEARESRDTLLELKIWEIVTGEKVFYYIGLQDLETCERIKFRQQILSLLRRSIDPLCCNTQAIKQTERRQSFKTIELPEIHLLIQVSVDVSLDSETQLSAASELTKLIDDLPEIATRMCDSTENFIFDKLYQRIKTLLEDSDEGGPPKYPDLDIKHDIEMALLNVLICLLDNCTVARLDAIQQGSPVSLMFAILGLPIPIPVRAIDVTRKLLRTSFLDTVSEDTRLILFTDFLTSLSDCTSHCDTSLQSGGKIVFLEIISSIARDDTIVQDVLMKTGCFEKIVSILYSDYGEPGNSEIVSFVLNTLSSIICENQKAHSMFRECIGYNTLRHLLEQKMATLDETFYTILFDFVVDKCTVKRHQTKEKIEIPDLSNKEVSHEKEIITKMETFIKNPYALLMLLNISEKSTLSIRISLMDDLIRLAKFSISNRAAMDEIDVVGLLLRWLTNIPDHEDQFSLVNRIIELLRVCSCFSISGNNVRLWLSMLQMKIEGECPPHYRQLIDAFCEATQQGESCSFFNFPGSKRSGIAYPYQFSWNSQRCISFVTWLRIESNKLFDNGSDAVLFNLFADKNHQVIMSLNAEGIRVRIDGDRKSDVSLLRFKIIERKWYHVGISISLNRSLISGHVKLFINGTCVSSTSTAISKISNHFKRSSVGMVSEYDHDETNFVPFYGQMATIYCFDDNLTDNSIRAIHSLGRKNSSLMLSSENSAARILSHKTESFDAIRDLLSKTKLAFTAAAICERGCYNLAKRAGMLATEGSISYDEIAGLLPETKPCVMYSVCDIITSHGGVGILLPLLPESFNLIHTFIDRNNFDGSSEVLHWNPSSVITDIIFKILNDSSENQDAMIKISGCDMLGFLFSHAPPSALDLSVLRSIAKFVQLRNLDSDLQGDIVQRLMMETAIWKGASERVRYDMLKTITVLADVHHEKRNESPMKLLYLAVDLIEQNSIEGLQTVDTKQILINYVNTTCRTPEEDTLRACLSILFNVDDSNISETILNFLLTKALKDDRWTQIIIDMNVVPLILQLLDSKSESKRNLCLRISGLILNATFASSQFAPVLLDADSESPIRNMKTIMSYLTLSSQGRNFFVEYICKTLRKKLCKIIIDESLIAELMVAVSGWDGFDVQSLPVPEQLTMYFSKSSDSSLSVVTKIREPICLELLLDLVDKIDSAHILAGLLRWLHAMVTLGSEQDENIEQLYKTKSWCSNICKAILGVKEYSASDSDAPVEDIADLGISVLVCMMSYSLNKIADGWGIIREIFDNFKEDHKNGFVLEFLRRLLNELLESSILSEKYVTFDQEVKIQDCDPLIENISCMIGAVGALLQAETNADSNNIQSKGSIYLYLSCLRILVQLTAACKMYIAKLIEKSNATKSYGNFTGSAFMNNSHTARRKLALDSNVREQVWKFLSTFTSFFIRSASVSEIALSIPKFKLLSHYLFDREYQETLSQNGLKQPNCSWEFCYHLSGLLQLKLSLQDGMEPARELLLSQVLQDILGQSHKIITNDVEGKDDEFSKSLCDLLKDHTLLEGDNQIKSLAEGLKKILNCQIISEDKESGTLESPTTKSIRQEASPARKWSIFTMASDEEQHDAIDLQTVSRIQSLKDSFKNFKSEKSTEFDRFISKTEENWKRFLRCATFDNGLWAESLASRALEAKERWCLKLQDFKDPSLRRWRLKRKFYSQHESPVEVNESGLEPNVEHPEYAVLPIRHESIDDEDSKDEVSEEFNKKSSDNHIFDTTTSLLQPSLAKEDTDSSRTYNDSVDKASTIRQKCSLITTTRVVEGEIRVRGDTLEFQEDLEVLTESSNISENTLSKRRGQKTKKLLIRKMSRLLLCRYLLRWSAIEIWMSNRQTVFFNFESTRIAQEIAKRLTAKSTYLIATQTPTSREEVPTSLGGIPDVFSGPLNSQHVEVEKSSLTYYFRKRKIESAERLKEVWRKRDMSNFDYIMNLNILAGRTFNDLTQYPVFPWIIQDYESESIDLQNPDTYRDLSLPIGAINPKRRQFFIERYNSFIDPEIPPFHYGTHYSSSTAVLYYLLRLEPFTSLHRSLQGGKFDHTERLFASIAQTWRNCLEDSSDVKELIPEFFYQPDFLRNVNRNDFGTTQSGCVVDDVTLPPWANNSPEEFIRINREALESDYVREHLHLWIDLVFGYKQRGDPAKEALNVFYYLTYEGAVDLDKVKDENQNRSIRAQINYFGQTPMQLFRRPHPSSEVKLLGGKSLTAYVSPVLSILSRLSPENSDTSYPILSLCTTNSLVLFIDSNRVLRTYKIIKSIAGDFSSNSSYPSYLEMEKTPGRRLAAPFAPEIIPDQSIFALSSNGRYVFSGGHWDSCIRASAIDDGREIQSISRHHAVVTCLGISEGRILISGSKDTSVMVWALHSTFPSSQQMHAKIGPIEDEPVHILHGHVASITCVAVSMSLSLAVSGAEDSPVLLHCLRKGDYLGQLNLNDHDLGIESGKATPLIVRISDSYGIIATYWSKFVISTHNVNCRCLSKVEVSEKIVEMKTLEECGLLITVGVKGSITIRSIHSLEIKHKVLSIGEIISTLTVINQKQIIIGTGNADIILASLEEEDVDEDDHVDTSK